MGTGQWSIDMSEQPDRFRRDDEVDPGAGAEQEIRRGGAIPDGTDTEGHAISGGFVGRLDGDDGDGRAFSPATPEGDDAEGQGMRYMVIPFSADTERRTRRRPDDEPSELRQRPGSGTNEAGAARNADKAGPDEAIRWRP
jgi:hypothetical protein